MGMLTFVLRIAFPESEASDKSMRFIRAARPIMFAMITDPSEVNLRPWAGESSPFSCSGGDENPRNTRSGTLGPVFAYREIHAHGH